MTCQQWDWPISVYSPFDWDSRPPIDVQTSAAGAENGNLAKYLACGDEPMRTLLRSLVGVRALSKPL